MNEFLDRILRRFVGLTTLDPTGAARTVVEWIPKYRQAAVERHAAFMAAWKAGDHSKALVELHLFLTSLNRIVDFMDMAGDRLGGDVKEHVRSRDFTPQCRARDHFEHIEDRLFGSKRSRLKEITERGAARTVHFGLRSADQHLTFSDQAVDVSKSFLADFLAFVDEFSKRVDQTLQTP